MARHGMAEQRLAALEAAAESRAAWRRQHPRATLTEIEAATRKRDVTKATIPARTTGAGPYIFETFPAVPTTGTAHPKVAPLGGTRVATQTAIHERPFGERRVSR